MTVFFNITMENFREPIDLSTIAGIADMSIPAFCNYFKKSTRKKYIDFLNEVRIGYACKLLTDRARQLLKARVMKVALIPLPTLTSNS